MITRKLNIEAKFSGSIEENLKFFGFSSRICARLKRSQDFVRVNGEHKFLTAPIEVGQVISIILDEDVSPIPKYDYKVNIIYEDDDIAIINKSADIAVIATSAYYGTSLMNALANVWGDFVYHPINRLDKGTSGLMAVAKNCLAHSILSNTLAEDGLEGKEVKREYLALAQGIIAEDMVIDEPIGMPYKTTLIRGVEYDNGKPARTFLHVEKYIGNHTLVRVRLATGRTHQIRVHLSHIGHPLAGDDLYGGVKTYIDRPALHSASLSMINPITKQSISIESNLPEDINNAINLISKENNK